MNIIDLFKYNIAQRKFMSMKERESTIIERESELGKKLNDTESSSLEDIIYKKYNLTSLIKNITIKERKTLSPSLFFSLWSDNSTSTSTSSSSSSSPSSSFSSSS